jgi:hypothetical protein
MQVSRSIIEVCSDESEPINPAAELVQYVPAQYILAGIAGRRNFQVFVDMVDQANVRMRRMELTSRLPS